MLVSELDTGETLRGRVDQTQVKGVMGHFLQVTARKRAEQREAQAQALAGWEAEWESSLKMLVPVCVLVHLYVSQASQAYLWTSLPSSVQRGAGLTLFQF